MKKKFTVRYWLKPCNGINPRTGLSVGSRHRWPVGWGVGCCEFCGRTLEQLRERVRIYDDGRIVKG